MFQGDLVEGELEIGQIAASIKQITSAAEVVTELITEYRQALAEQTTEKYLF